MIGALRVLDVGSKVGKYDYVSREDNTSSEDILYIVYYPMMMWETGVKAYCPLVCPPNVIAPELLPLVGHSLQKSAALTDRPVALWSQGCSCSSLLAGRPSDLEGVV